MSQLLSPDGYAELCLEDQFVEDEFQHVECHWLRSRIAPRSQVLEMGFGAGIVAKSLVDAGHRVTVLEGAAKFAEEAKQHVHAVIHGTFEDAKITEEYDYVINSFVLEHLADPALVMQKMRLCARRMLIVVANAESYHRKVAVHMGLQPRLDSLSERDKIVGHYRVYDYTELQQLIYKTGWRVTYAQGLWFKCLPNKFLKALPVEVIRGLCSLPMPLKDAGILAVECERVTV